MDERLDDVIRRLEQIEANTATNDAELGDDVTPAFGFEDVLIANDDELKVQTQDRKIVEVTAEEAMMKGQALLAEGAVVSIDAAGLGHTPDGRGRRTGPSNRYWRDYCNTTSGRICYGPYHDLDPGVYVFYYNYKFQVPVCGGANNTIVFEMDTTRNVGHRIPGSKVWVDRWNVLCQRADEDNIVDGSYGGRFAIAERTNKVEMRLGNQLTTLAGIRFEILVRRLMYWKE